MLAVRTLGNGSLFLRFSGFGALEEYFLDELWGKRGFLPTGVTDICGMKAVNLGTRLVLLGTSRLRYWPNRFESLLIESGAIAFEQNGQEIEVTYPTQDELSVIRCLIETTPTVAA